MPRSRIAEFIGQLPAKSAAIVPSATEVIRSHDTHFRFRQNSDFFYLTGFDEPDSIAVFTPDREKKYTLFVRPRDPEKEVWDGYRAGVEGAVGAFGADEAFPVAEFDEKLPELLDGTHTLYYRLGDGNDDLDSRVIRCLARMRAQGRKGVIAPDSVTETGVIVHEMRLRKSPEEVAVMERAAAIAAEAHIEAMKAVRPGVMEFEIEALIEFIFRRNGAIAPAYTTIVGSGANATVLHYVSNDSEMKDGDLLLIDAGCEYQGYASDITRTFPVNGRFSGAQRDVYELVLATQLDCMRMVRPGVSMEELNQHSVQLLTDGMLRLGLIEGEKEKLIEEEKHKQFYMHRLGHFLGMDVHDAGRYFIDQDSRCLEPGMVITVEPGLYIAPSAENIPDAYRGIGVRIEDDVLVTEAGCRVLTSEVPKQIEEIESLMAGRE